MKQQTLIPDLRFPEFEGEWEEKMLGEIGTTLSGLTYSPNDIHPEGTLVLRSSNVKNNSLVFSDNVYVKVDSYNEVVKNDILLVVRNGSKRLIGKCALINKNSEGMAFGAFMSVYRSKHNRFLIQWFWGDDFKKEVHKNLGATINSINGSNLKKFKIAIPSLPEQQKIASFLTTIDKRLQALEKKKSLWEQYKKGVMQGLFRQLSELRLSGLQDEQDLDTHNPTILESSKSKFRQLRFKDEDGNGFPDWEEKKLGEVCEIKTGNRDTQNKVNNGKYPFYVRSQTIERIDSYSFDGEAILTSGDGVGVGKNYHYINGKFDFHQRVYCLRRFHKNINGKFVYYYFSDHFFKRVMSMTAKNSVDSVRRDMITNMRIPLPSLKEQTRIANFLTALDKKIALVSEQIEKTKTFKKGLLQKMFV